MEKWLLGEQVFVKCKFTIKNRVSRTSKGKHISEASIQNEPPQTCHFLYPQRACILRIL